MSQRSLLITTGLVFSLAGVPALAQTFPSKPIRVVVPFPAGSATDAIARVITPAVAQALGQSLVIDNKPGADGAIAATEVAKAAADGHTLLFATNSPMAAVPALRKQPPYDPVADFAPVTDLGRYTFFLFASAAAPFKTLPEMIAHAKANAGKLNYATGNTTGIVSFAQMNALAGINMTHVPYKGEPAAVVDLVANRVQVMFATITTGGAHAREGRLKALVTTLPSRSPAMPEVPTIAEAGMPQFSMVSWAALFAPGGTPREVVSRLNREFVAAMQRPEVMSGAEKQAFFLRSSTPEQLGAFVREQKDSYARILREAGVQPE
ncbi:MAG: tripartite tricarboxylate transporter substrate binding protein [Burkholderiales bacterium]|nr:tripartite tricarboxylate transporter substrate binding protein [Burkholderiales bacterium]